MSDQSVYTTDTQCVQNASRFIDTTCYAMKQLWQVCALSHGLKPLNICKSQAVSTHRSLRVKNVLSRDPIYPHDKLNSYRTVNRCCEYSHLMRA